MKPIIDAKPVWQSGGLAAVCEKCLVRFVEDLPEHTGDERLANVKGRLKDRLKADGRWGPIRVVTTSCLDICAKGRLTVLLDPIGHPDRRARCIVVDPLIGYDALYEEIVAELSPREAAELSPGDAA